MVFPSGEFDFLRWVKAQAQSSERISVGIGDDLAALRWDAGDLLLVGADQVLDGVHFDAAVHPPELIGRKAMNRNLSDCAAMGCLPAAAVVTVALPRDAGEAYAKRLHAGLLEAGRAFGCELVGGDTGSWPGKLVLSVTVLGRSGGVAPVTRGGARAGDGVYVSGPLGGSILGRHLTFEPRVALGRRLAESGRVTAMLDLSDGLSRDVRHLCDGNGLGVVIEAGAVPVHADAVTLSQRDGRPALWHALHDGEDYELLFTGDVEPSGDAVRVGTVVGEPGVWIEDLRGEREMLEPGGWEHRL